MAKRCMNFTTRMCCQFAPGIDACKAEAVTERLSPDTSLIMEIRGCDPRELNSRTSDTLDHSYNRSDGDYSTAGRYMIIG
jgi:hypothetical protein